MPKPEITSGNGSRIWWAELIRREGILTTLVLIWVFAIAVPESKDRRETLTKSQAVMEAIGAAVEQIKSSEATQVTAVVEAIRFRERIEKQHEQQAADHQALRDAVGRLKPAG
jgi:hypothetical protein